MQPSPKSHSYDINNHAPLPGQESGPAAGKETDKPATWRHTGKLFAVIAYYSDRNLPEYTQEFSIHKDPHYRTLIEQSQKMQIKNQLFHIEVPYLMAWLENPGEFDSNDHFTGQRLYHFYSVPYMTCDEPHKEYDLLIQIIHTIDRKKRWTTVPTSRSEKMISEAGSHCEYDFHIAFYEKTRNIPLNELKGSDSLLCFYKSEGSKDSGLNVVAIHKTWDRNYLYFDPFNPLSRSNNEHRCADILHSEADKKGVTPHAFVKLSSVNMNWGNN